MVRIIALVEPKDEASRKDFDEWYLGNHVESFSHTPGIVKAEVNRLERPYMGGQPSQYITIYEFETDDVDEAMEAANLYLQNPTWPGNQPARDCLKLISVGWYKVDKSFSQSD